MAKQNETNVVLMSKGQKLVMFWTTEEMKCPRFKFDNIGIAFRLKTHHNCQKYRWKKTL